MWGKNLCWSVDMCFHASTQMAGGWLWPRDFPGPHFIALVTLYIEQLSRVVSGALSGSHSLWLCSLKESQWCSDFSCLPPAWPGVFRAETRLYRFRCLCGQEVLKSFWASSLDYRVIIWPVPDDPNVEQVARGWVGGSFSNTSMCFLIVVLVVLIPSLVSF